MADTTPHFEGPDLFTVESFERVYLKQAAERGERLSRNFSDHVLIPRDLPVDSWPRYRVPAVATVNLSGIDFEIDMVTMASNPTLEGVPLFDYHRPTHMSLVLPEPGRTPHYLLTLWCEMQTPLNATFSYYPRLAELLGVDLFELDRTLEDLTTRSEDPAFWQPGQWVDFLNRPYGLEAISS